MSSSSAAIAVSWSRLPDIAPSPRLAMIRRNARQRVCNDSTCLGQRQKKELQPGAVNKHHFCVYHRISAVEVHGSAWSRRKSTSFFRLGQYLSAHPGSARDHRSLERGPAAILTRCPHPRPARHSALCPLADAVSPRALVRPSWPSAVLPPRPTTTHPGHCSWRPPGNICHTFRHAFRRTPARRPDQCRPHVAADGRPRKYLTPCIGEVKHVVGPWPWRAQSCLRC